MSSLKTLNLKAKIIGLLLMVILVLSAATGKMLYEFNQTDETYTNYINSEVKEVTRLTYATRYLQSVGYRTYQFAYNPIGSPLSEIALESHAGNAENLLKTLDSTIEVSSSTEVKEFKERAISIVEISKKAIKEKQSGLLDQAIVTLEKLDEEVDSLTTDLRVYGDKKYEIIKTNAITIAEHTDQTVVTSAFVYLATALIGLVVAYILSQKTITSPLNKLQTTMMGLADGDLALEIPGIDRSDEIGSMAKAVEHFKANGIRSIELEAEAEANRKAAEADRESNEREKAATAEEDRVSIQALLEGLSSLASGDLSHRIEANFPERSIRLKTDFNSSIENLQRTMLEITQAIAAIHSGTNEISTAADDLSHRTEQQAATLEETAAALDEITSTVKSTASGASHAKQTVEEAKTSAERSGVVVRQAIDAMGMIEKSSQQISQIIGVIDEIAFQTNLLALNAGVEAARAGDAGRGFAVVASEVRSLAQRSAEAAKEIKALIQTSTNQVEEGVELVGETGKELKQIAIQIADITAVVNNIAVSAQEQSSGLQQVNTAVNQMDQVTQQNAAMVEESTAASHSLAQEAEELSRLISTFKLGEETKPASRSSKPQTASKKSSSRSKPTETPKALRTPVASSDDDGWKEF